jgi:hypothetical protein
MVPHPRSARRLALLFLLCAPSAIGQESKALFDAPYVVAGPRERFEAVCDLNADGYMDAIGVWWENVEYARINVTGWINDQTGRLVTHWSVGLPVTPVHPAKWSIATGDLNGDGLPDLVVGAGLRVQVFRSTGGGVTSPMNIAPLVLTGAHVADVRIDDYDGDGALDVAVLHDHLTIYHVNTATMELTPFTEIQTGVTDAALFAVEMNGDGAPDLLVSDPSNVSLYPIVGGQLQSPMIIAHQCAYPKPQAGDLDGDGDEDIILFDVNTYTLLRRSGPSAYTPEYGHPGGTARFLHDLDGDGDLDGVCCGGGGGGPSPVYNDLPSSWRMSFNDGLGNFSTALELPGLGSEKLAGAADLDHDGDLDLVAGRTVFYARGPWSRLAAPTLVTEPRDSQLADFDCDADVDLKLSVSGVGRNLGEGRPAPFVPRTSPPPPNRAYSSSSYVGDFDGDGDVDQVVMRRTVSPDAFEGMTLLLNEGGGSFVDAGDATPPGTPMTTAAHAPEDRISTCADFDADGDLDIVAVSAFSLGSRLWANDGAGHFTLATTIPAVVQIVADFNGDNVPDLAGSTPAGVGSTSGRVSTWRGLGNAAFDPPQFLENVSTSLHQSSIAIGDIEGDGDRDIVACGLNGVVHVFVNGLSEGYTYMGEYQFNGVGITGFIMGAVSTVSVFDVNGDGRNDIVAGPADGTAYRAPGSSAVILRRSNNMGYEPSWLQVMRASAAADADGDGDVDAIGSHVWLNARISGPNASACRQTETGTPDAFGMTPTLGGKGPYHVGHPVDIRLTGAPPQVNGYLFVVDGPFPAESPDSASVLGFGFSRSLKRVPFHTSGVAGWSGTGAWSLNFTVPGYVAGKSRTYVALMPDPAAPGNPVRSNEFTIRYVP